jgi:3-oxoacyl-[acyl-carrier-protein] synthase-3
MTKFVHPTDKTRIIFGDGATAIKIEKENDKENKKGFRILRTDIVTYATDPQNVHYPTEIQKNATEDQRLRMNLRGGEVYRAGVGLSESFIRKYLEENNIDLEEIDYVIPHQANGSMLESLDEVLALGKNKYGESKLLSNIETTGNTAASSIPLCLFDFQQQGKFKNGDRILMCSFAAGYALGIVEVEVVS